MNHFVWVLVLLAGALPVALANQAEVFDTSGMPRRPTNFIEQQLFEMIGSHTPGDLTDAARIQRKLGRYYADKGDEARATTAFQRAAKAEQPMTEQNPPPAGATAEEVVPPPPPPGLGAGSSATGGATSAFSGNYFGSDGRTLHTWDFARDGSFLHTWIVSGAGTSVRNSERGKFALVGHSLELVIGSSASGFVTPGFGARTTVVGGGADASTETRRLKIDFLKSENSIMLDGVKLKPKSW
jgi:hypothetical protein